MTSVDLTRFNVFTMPDWADQPINVTGAAEQLEASSKVTFVGQKRSGSVEINVSLWIENAGGAITGRYELVYPKEVSEVSRKQTGPLRGEVSDVDDKIIRLNPTNYLSRPVWTLSIRD